MQVLIMAACGQTGVVPPCCSDTPRKLANDHRHDINCVGWLFAGGGTRSCVRCAACRCRRRQMKRRFQARRSWNETPAGQETSLWLHQDHSCRFRSLGATSWEVTTTSK